MDGGASGNTGSGRNAGDGKAPLAGGNPALVQEARRHLKKDGVQWTRLRAQVFTALNKALDKEHQPQSAYTIAEEVSRLAGRRVAANSIYRILDLFVAHGLAKRVESRNAFIPNVHPAHPHDCIFLVCDSCGRVEHLDDDRLTTAVRGRAEATGFTPGHAVFELLGTCARCRGH